MMNINCILYQSFSIYLSKANILIMSNIITTTSEKLKLSKAMRKYSIISLYLMNKAIHKRIYFIKLINKQRFSRSYLFYVNQEKNKKLSMR